MSDLPANILTIATREQILTKIIAMVQSKLPGKQARQIVEFAQQYYANVSVEDLNEREIPDLYGALISHWKLICQRKKNECLIRVYNPNYEQDGWHTTHTVIEIACNDMPFLVDSIRMEINRQGFRIHFIIHLGGVKIRRDDKFQVIDILPRNGEAPDIVPEAPIYIEVDRHVDSQSLEDLRIGLLRVLGDVRVCVEDWAQMRERMREAILELECKPPPYDPFDISESLAFLRWLDDDHFTYLGCRDYELVGDGENLALSIVKGSGLGVLHQEEKSKPLRLVTSLPPAARELAFAEHVLVVSKTNTKSTIHRPVYTDYIGIKRFNEQGELIGERRFIGLYTSTAYNSHPKDIPLLRFKVAQVIEESKLPLKGHSGKVLMDILVTLPRDDLFQATTEELTELALGILQIQERHQIRLFVRQDAYRRFVSCLVYVPHEQFNTELSFEIQDILMDAFHGLEVTSFPLFSESSLARVHFLIRTDPTVELTYNVKDIEAKLIEAGRSWKEELQAHLINYYGDAKGGELYNKYSKAFPASYRENFTARTAIFDIEHIEKLSETHSLEMNFYRPVGESLNNLHFKLFQADKPIILSVVLPMLENMGLQVIDERPHELVLKNGKHVWINDFGMTHPEGEKLDVDAVREVFQEAFARIWFAEAEDDGFNRLVLASGLTWLEAVVLRAYCKYLRQIGFMFSQAYVETTLVKNNAIAKQLVELFILKFDPNQPPDAVVKREELIKRIKTALDAVANLDEDRIIRRYLEVILATLRTNYFQKTAAGQSKAWLALKLNSNQIVDMPLPRPLYEIFVYSPRVEAIHLRAAKVARGGIRWSDRREDFRTEVLGLMKAQQVKNAVIVPAGAKGGFVVKLLPQDGTREAIMDEVIACYQTFMRGMLDITDNLAEGGVVVQPPQTYCYDDSDPYLVVAADKGTASFSDIANAIAAEYNFWLGDAFASGGSSGYDHKKMGITARGAWESVKRHFNILGIDPDAQDFTVIGIGDMAGDVFGNGMLLSHHIKLVAAFNNAHIFLDPDPDAEASYRERERLFKLPRSTWEDYNPALISNGGGVFKRSLKAIPLSPEIKKLLKLDQNLIEPNDLIRVILQAEVDLLWNGGIGTFVKAITEKNIEVGDRTNDSIRINGCELRCRAVGEGGNLGFTQLGRIEYALQNGLIYTDFIDNSAGVDCSDHEVNCKILLNKVIEEGDLTLKQRNELLVAMTQEIAELVLSDNYGQTRAINVMALQSNVDLDFYQQYINTLEQTGKLNRDLEFLPDDKVLLERKIQAKGLTNPELAILLAYTKIVIKAQLLDSEVLIDPYLSTALETAFPKPLRQKYRNQMESHRLRREIIATQISNTMINDMGVLFVARIQAETGADLASIVRAYTIAGQIFAMHDLMQLAEQLSPQVAVEKRNQVFLHVVRLIRRAARWFLRDRKDHLTNIAATITLFRQGIIELNSYLPEVLVGSEREEWEENITELKSVAISTEKAHNLVALRYQYPMLDIIAAATENDLPLNNVAAIHFAVGEYLDFVWLRKQITQQPVEMQWDALARAILRDDLDNQQRNLTIAIMRETADLIDVDAKITTWTNHHQPFIQRWQQLLAELRNTKNPQFIMYSVVIRELVELVRHHETEFKAKRHTDVRVKE